MTDWEMRYQSADMPWEKGRASPPLLELLDQFEADAWGMGPVLVPGCGLGHDVRALTRLGIPIVGVDLAPTAIELARKWPQASDEAYELGDFLDPEWSGERKFSAMWEHTCFCAIDPSKRPKYAEAAAGCLTDGGLLAGVFFLTPFDPGEEACGPPFPTTVDELDGWFTPWFDRIDGWVPRAAYAGREGREWIGLFRKRAQP
jgi:SAM-dependent methyltransferase